jgi:GT2 family glycosyltransferase
LPSLAVIIVSYNTRDLLAACLDSLKQEIGDWRLETETESPIVYRPSSLPNLQSPISIIVVDNASTDDSAELVRERYPWVRLMASAANLGFAGANNLALRALGFTNPPQSFANRQSLPGAVLLLNPDTRVKPGAIRRLGETLFSASTIGIVGPRLTYPDGQLQHNAFAFPGLAQTALDLFPPRGRLARVMETRLNGRYPRAWYQAGPPFAVETLLGACLMVRGAAIRTVGLLDERFFMYAEELDWCRRFRDAGWRLLCDPGAEVVHYEAQSTRQFRERMTVELWRSRLRLFDKHYRGARRLALRGLVWVGAWVNARRAPAARRRAYTKIAALAQGKSVAEKATGKV